MALPTTIVSVAGMQGHHPPWKSSAGNFYSIVRASATALDAYKATDPADSWTVQDSAGHPSKSNGYDVVAVKEHNDILYVATATFISASTNLRLAAFNMATDNWDFINETIEDTAQEATFQWISVAVRSNGDVVVVYAGDTDQVMGGKKERVDANVRSGSPPSWSGPIALWGTGNLDIHYGNPNCVLGTNNGTHCTWQDDLQSGQDPPTAWQAYDGRTLNSSDTLSTIVQDSGIETFSVLLGMQNGVSYDDSGTQRIIFCGAGDVGAGDMERVYFIGTEDGSDNFQTGTSVADTVAPEPFANGEVGIITMTELNDDLHVLFSGGGTDGVDQDLHYTKSTDNGVSWSAPTEEIDGITVNFISANIYVRGLNTVMAYVYDDGGVQKYNEKFLKMESWHNPSLLVHTKIGARYY